LALPVTTDTAAQLDQLFQTQFPDPVARQAFVRALIGALGLPATSSQPLNFLTNNFYLDKRLLGNLAIQGVRNTVIASLYSTNRTALTSSLGGSAAGDFSSSSNIKQVGVSGTWSSRISQTLTFNTLLSVVRNEFVGLNRRDYLKTLSVGLTKQFDPKVNSSLIFRRLKNDSDAASAEYAENSVTATLGIIF
jgi:uncharacterized protein (PEP-CTERM system associated)